MATRTDNSIQDEPSRDDLTLPVVSSADSAAGRSLSERADAVAAAGFNVSAAVLRRWPLLLVALVGGLVFGFLIHLKRIPVYQSGAQVLVIKKRSSSAAGPGTVDARQAYLEDYVSTQVTLIKSEQILMAAGNRLNQQAVDVELPPTPRDRASMIARDLTVTRDKESFNPLAGGSGVLILTYRSLSPNGSKAILAAVIDAYQAELSSIYDEASRSEMKNLESRKRMFVKQLEETKALRGEKNDALRRITEEDPQNIRHRLSAMRDREITLEEEKVDLDRQLKVVEDAGSDRKRRLAAVYMLTQLSRLSAGSDTANPNGPEFQLRTLELQHQEHSDRLGQHHPDLKSLQRKIDLLKEQLFRGDDEANDGLFPIKQRLLQMKSSAEEKLAMVKSQIRADRETLNEAGRFQDEILQLGESATKLDQTIRDLETRYKEIETTQSSGGYEAKVITEPAPGLKVAPVLLQSLFLGALLGVLVGTGLAVLAEKSDQGFRSPADVRQRLGLPVIGHLPRLNPETALANSEHPNLDANLVIIHKPKSTEAEAYRGVRTQLYFSTQGRGHQMIQVTSPNPGDGKSTLAANLAASVAQSGKRTIIVDCDLRKPRVHKVWNLPNPDVGMSTVVAGNAELRDAIQKSEIPNLDVLPCGPRPANPAELLTSPAFVETINELRNLYDFVILDTPPMLAVSDPAVVAPRVDGVILVLRMSKKARPAAERARELLGAVGANIIGVAVNGIGNRSEGYGYGYGYGYGNYGYNYGYNYQYQYQYQYEYADSYADDPEETEALDAVKPALKG